MRAEAAYRKAIEVDPSYANAYDSLGDLLSKDALKRYDEAEAAYRKAIEVDPSYAYAYDSRGRLLSNQPFEALRPGREAAFRKAIELNPLDAYAYNYLGDLLSNDAFKRYYEGGKQPTARLSKSIHRRAFATEPWAACSAMMH